MLIGQGRLDNSQPFRQGGIVERPILFGIDVAEIVRTTSLAIRRRTELLGAGLPPRPLDRRTVDRVDQTARAAQPLVGVLDRPRTGAGAGGRGQGGAGGHQPRAQRRGGRPVRPPLDGHRAVGAGTSGLGPGRSQSGGQLLRGDDVFGGVLRRHRGSGRGLSLRGAGPSAGQQPGLPTRRWPRRSAGPRATATASCSVRSCCRRPRTRRCWARRKQAAAMLDEAKSVFSRRDMAAGRLGARCSMLTALVLFQEGNLAAGDQAVAAAMTYMRHGSFWLFHIGLADAHLRGRLDHASRGDRSVRRGAPRSAAGRLGHRPDGIAGRAPHAASRALRALVRGHRGPKGVRQGPGDRRPRGDTAGSARWATADGWSRCDGSSKRPKRPWTRRTSWSAGTCG